MRVGRRRSIKNVVGRRRDNKLSISTQISIVVVEKNIQRCSSSLLFMIHDWTYVGSLAFVQLRVHRTGHDKF